MRKTGTKSRPSWIDELESAFSDGRFTDTVHLYAEHAGISEPPRLAILTARAQMHSDPAAALRLLLSIGEPDLKRREKVERDILLAEAFSRTNDFDSADERLAAALKAASATNDGEMIAAVGYRRVRRYLHGENVEEARKWLGLARKGESRASRLYALFVETVLLSYERRTTDQAFRLVELLRMLDPGLNEFHEVRAWSTHALAILARELFLPDAIAEVDRQLSGLPWPSDFAHNRFQTLKALGWAKAIRGDYFNGFRHLKQASGFADSVAWKVVAACDRSYLARRLGEHRWSRVELDEAEQLADTVQWHATLGEERTGLLLMAELFSSIDIGRSAMYLGRYRELGPIRSSVYYGHDARILAFERYSTGIVEFAMGNRKRALTEMRQSREVFEQFGYDFRVAQCALAEYGETGIDQLLAIATERLRNYGQSWLAAELRSIGEQPGDVVLPPMQKRVFDEICKGKTTAEIAQTLDRSEFTISNHIKWIFKTFGVSNRTSLLAVAARRGILKAD